MQMLYSAWDGLWTEMEEGADAPLRKIVRGLTTIVQGVTRWTHEHPRLTAAIGETTLAVGGLLTVAGAVLGTIGGPIILFSLTRLSLRLTGIGGAAAEAAGGVSILSGALGGFQSLASGVLRFVSFIAGALMTIPGIVALVFAGLSAAIIYWWDDLVAFWRKLENKFAEMASSRNVIVAGFGQFALDLAWPFQKLYDLIDSVVTRVERLLVSLGLLKQSSVLPDALKNSISDLQGDLSKALLPDRLRAKANALKSDIKAALTPPPSGRKPEFGTGHWDAHDKEKKTPRGGSGTDNAGRLGDIVFKTLPGWIALRGKYEQPLITGPAGSRLVAPTTAGSETPSIGNNVSGDINPHIHIDGATHMNPQHIAQEVERKVMSALNKLKRQQLGSLKDRE